MLRLLVFEKTGPFIHSFFHSFQQVDCSAPHKGGGIPFYASAKNTAGEFDGLLRGAPSWEAVNVV